MNFLVKKDNEQHVVSLFELKQMFDNVSFPNNFQGDAEMGIYPVVERPKPDYNEMTHRLVDAGVQYDEEKDEYYYEYTTELLSQEEQETIFNGYVQRYTATVQQHLDLFARTRNYDNIQSAVSYKGCGVQKFEVEADYCNRMRAQVWATLYTMLDEVLSGNREIPSSSTEVIDMLPVLEWPEIE